MTLISAADTSVPVTVQRRSPLNPVLAFDIIVPIDLSLVFARWGPFPGVRGVNNQTGAWDHVGVSRNPDLTDGSTATETSPNTGAAAASLTNSPASPTSLAGSPTASAANGPSRQTAPELSSGGPTNSSPAPFCSRLVQHGLAPLWRRHMQTAVNRTVSAAEQLP